MESTSMKTTGVLHWSLMPGRRISEQINFLPKMPRGRISNFRHVRQYGLEPGDKVIILLEESQGIYLTVIKEEEGGFNVPNPPNIQFKIPACLVINEGLKPDVINFKNIHPVKVVKTVG